MPFDKSQALNAAKQHLLQGNTQAAISVYLKIIEDNPEDLPTINRLGDLYASEGRVQDAIYEFSRVADRCRAGGLTRKAIAVLRKLAALDPGNIETSFKLAEAYTQAGLPSDARQHYLQIAEDYTSKGQTLDALAVYCKIVGLDPANTSTRIKLGELYLREGLNEQAYETFITAADQLAKNGEHRRALNAYNEALAIRPDGAEALAGVSRIPIRDSGALTNKPWAIDSLSGALREPQQSGELESVRDSRALDQNSGGEDSTFVVQEISKAEMLVAYGQVGQAISMLNNVATSLPENIDVRIKLKDIYLRNGMMAEASAECRRLELIYQARGDDSRARDYAIRASKLTQRIERPSDDLHSPAPVRMTAQARPDASPAAGITQKHGEHIASRADPEPALIQTVTSRPLSATAERVLLAPLHLVRQEEPSHEALLNLNPESGPINRLAVEVISSRPIDVVTAPVRPGLVVSPQIVKKRSRVAVAGIAAGVLLTIGGGATIGGLIYDNHLNKQYQALTLASPEEVSSPLAVSVPQESEPAQSADSMTVDVTPDVTPATKSETPREQALDHRSLNSEEPAPSPAPSEQPRPVTRQASPSPAPPSTNVNADSRSTADSRTPAGVPATVPTGPAVPAAPPPKVVTQSSGVVFGAAVKRVEPGYPDVARQNKQLGSVRVEVGIDEQGNVATARALSGPLLLQNAAVAAARGWKFRPSTIGGLPVKTTTVIVFNFKL
jgi:TonB family protein